MRLCILDINEYIIGPAGDDRFFIVSLHIDSFFACSYDR